MRRVVAPVILALLMACVGSPGGGGVNRPSEVPTPEGIAGESLLANLPLYFVENRGQVPGPIDYYLHGSETSVGFSSDGVLLTLADRQGTSQRWALGLEFVGARATPPVGRGITPAVVSYFKGDPEEWVTGLPTYRRVAYQDLWPGIDLVYAGTGSQLKYSFVVQPGADPADIRLAVRGASALHVNSTGQLEVATPAGDLVDDTPYIYQVIGGRRVEVPSAYAVAGDRYGFDVGPYEPTRRLVIDPAMLVYAGYIGGADGDFGLDIAVDGAGAAYVTGYTSSTQATFPDGDGFGAVTGPDSSYNGATDAFVAKLSASGTSLAYAGYIGGAGADGGYDIDVDGSGAAYVTGTAGSSQATFPDGDGFGTLTGPDTTHNGGIDAFVVKLAPSGTSLFYAGYVGGSLDDFGYGIAVDGAGAAYITGRTNSDAGTFPDGDGFGTVMGPDPTDNGGSDSFVAKVAPSGASLSYAGYIGGSAFDGGFGIDVDGAGAAYVTGSTASTQVTFPDGDGFGTVTGPDTIYNGGGDAFVAKVAPAGTSLVYAGYVGGSLDDVGGGIAVDGTGAAFVGGSTLSDQSTFPDGDGFGPVTGLDTTQNGDYDAFVAKVAPPGTTLSFAGYIGGSGEDYGGDLSVDGAGAAYLVGSIASTQATFPDGDGFGTVTGPDTTHNGGFDLSVAKVAPTGTSLVYAGYIGGSGDEGGSIAIDGAGAVYVIGQTDSTQATFPDGDGFGPVTGSDGTYNGGGDAFVAKVAEPGPSAICKGKPATQVGTKGADTLTGTKGADVIAALGGNDTVKAKGGKDLACAGSGRDTANGGGGKDKIYGEAGKDKLKGAGGNDKLNGGPGKDTCIGGPGKDKGLKCEKEKSIP